jgi:hypothetical protein
MINHKLALQALFWCGFYGAVFCGNLKKKQNLGNFGFLTFVLPSNPSIFQSLCSTQIFFTVRF